MLTNRILPEIIDFKEKHHLSPPQKYKVLEPPLLDAVTWFCFPSTSHLPQKLKKIHNLFSNKLYISHEHVISKKKRGFFFYMRKPNACKALLLALQPGTNHKWGLKVNWATSGTFFYYFSSLFWSGEFILTKLIFFFFVSPCSLFFSLPNQWGIYKLLFKDRKRAFSIPLLHEQRQCETHMRRADTVMINSYLKMHL